MFSMGLCKAGNFEELGTSSLVNIIKVQSSGLRV